MKIIGSLLASKKDGTGQVDTLQVITKTVNIENPTNSEDLNLFFTDVPLKVESIRGIVRGSGTPSIRVDLRHSTDRSEDSGTSHQIVGFYELINNTTTGQDLDVTGDATIPVNSWVWLETIEKNGTVNELGLTLRLTEDP